MFSLDRTLGGSTTGHDAVGKRNSAPPLGKAYFLTDYPVLHLVLKHLRSLSLSLALGVVLDIYKMRDEKKNHLTH
jgi:hypothetical protein